MKINCHSSPSAIAPKKLPAPKLASIPILNASNENLVYGFSRQTYSLDAEYRNQHEGRQIAKALLDTHVSPFEGSSQFLERAIQL
jgi:hypothetical protein